MADVGRLDEEQFSRTCRQLINAMRIGLAFCDEAMRPLFVSETALRLLRHFGGCEDQNPLPNAIVKAFHDYLEKTVQQPSMLRVEPERVLSPDGRLAVYVAGIRIRGVPGVAAVVRMHEEVARSREIIDRLQRRFRLSAREVRMVGLIQSNKTSAEIADLERLSLGTVRVYLHRLYEKLSVHSRAELLRLVEHVRLGDDRE